MVIKNIAVHNFGPTGTDPLSKSAHLTESNINNAHKNRWPELPSELNGSYIGYNFIIYPDGEMRQYRFIGEETAAQKGHNFDTLSICLAGNFTTGVESPTLTQKMKLKNTILALLRNDLKGMMIKPGTSCDFSVDRIYPHRVLQPNHTSCYGNSLSDNWAKSLVTNEVQISLLTTLLELYRKLLKLKKLGSVGVDCGTADVRG